jgi:hypothetical protein
MNELQPCISQLGCLRETEYKVTMCAFPQLKAHMIMWRHAHALVRNGSCQCALFLQHNSIFHSYPLGQILTPLYLRHDTMLQHSQLKHT